MSNNVQTLGREEDDVLIIEDDPVQRIALSGFLSRIGLKVSVAGDGGTALRQATMHPPRVAIIDFNLPDMNGVVLAQKLRAFLPTTAFLLMSSQIDGVSEETLSEVGITLFVNKPIPPAALRAAIVKLVQTEPHLRRGGNAPRGWLAAGLGGTRT